MKRRVVLHGPSTLTISLPSSWIKKHNIEKGDELEVEEDGNLLKIGIEKNAMPIRRISVDITGINHYGINTILAMLHKSGYDEIEILFEDPAKMKVIRDRIYSMLIGFELIEQTSKSCLVKSVSTNECGEFNAFFRRTFLVTLSLAEQSYAMVRMRGYSNVDDLLLIEETNNRLSNYCERLLCKGSSVDAKHIFHYIIVWTLESICDDYKMMLRYLKKNPLHKPRKDFLALFARTNQILRAYYDLYYKYSDKCLDDFHMQICDMANALFASIDDTDRRDILLLVCLHSIISRIHDALASTAGLNH